MSPATTRATRARTWVLAAVVLLPILIIIGLSAAVSSGTL